MNIIILFYEYYVFIIGFASSWMGTSALAMLLLFNPLT